MEHSLAFQDDPWRRRARVAWTIAGIELVVILVAGTALAGRAMAHKVKEAAISHVVENASVDQARLTTAPAGKPKLAPAKTPVVVLNGNGVAGAAGRAAARVRARGYKVRAVGNAARTDYPQSVVMYTPGLRAEAKQLAKRLGVHVVGPLDGVSRRELAGAKLALIIGA